MVVAPLRPALAAVEHRKGDYAVDVAILYGMFTLHLEGTVDEVVDRAAGRYDVTLRGEGGRVANRVDCHGILRDGRWSPTRSTREDRPARIVFGADRRPELVASSLILGTSVIISMGGLARAPQTPRRSERHGRAATLLDGFRLS